jgi:hypothetical protein
MNGSWLAEPSGSRSRRADADISGIWRGGATPRSAARGRPDAVRSIVTVHWFQVRLDPGTSVSQGGLRGASGWFPARFTRLHPPPGSRRAGDSRSPSSDPNDRSGPQRARAAGRLGGSKGGWEGSSGPSVGRQREAIVPLTVERRNRTMHPRGGQGDAAATGLASAAREPGSRRHPEPPRAPPTAPRRLAWRRSAAAVSPLVAACGCR